jgi:hypothetical protein
LFSIDRHIPKLNVAGSIPVSRSIKSAVYRSSLLQVPRQSRGSPAPIDASQISRTSPSEMAAGKPGLAAPRFVSNAMKPDRIRLAAYVPAVSSARP